jgi:hypothetical protein
MGRLWFPFIAASGALMIGAVVFSPLLFWRWRDEQQLLGGILLGIIASVVLYGIMRAIAGAPDKVRVSHARPATLFRA